MKTKNKPYSKMTAAELARATAAYDLPGSKPKFAKPPARLKQSHDRILRRLRRKRGRPVVGAGSQRVQVTMERGLLSRVDDYSRQLGITRSQLLSRALLSLLTNAT